MANSKAQVIVELRGDGKLVYKGVIVLKKFFLWFSFDATYYVTDYDWQESSELSRLTMERSKATVFEGMSECLAEMQNVLECLLHKMVVSKEVFNIPISGRKIDSANMVKEEANEKAK